MNWTELALEILKQPEWLRDKDVKLWDETDGDGVSHDVIELVSPTNNGEDPTAWTEDSGCYMSLCFNRNDDAWKVCNVVVPSSMANQDSGEDIVNLVKLLTGEDAEIVDATSGHAAEGPYEEGDIAYRVDGKGYELSYDWDEIGGGFCRIVRHTVEPKPELDAKPYIAHIQIPVSVWFKAASEDEAERVSLKLRDRITVWTRGGQSGEIIHPQREDALVSRIMADLLDAELIELQDDSDDQGVADCMLNENDVNKILKG